MSEAITRRRASRFPVTIAEWPHGRNGELLRVAIDRFKNSFTVSIRLCRKDQNGVLRPSLTGLTLGIRHLPKLAEGIAQARERAELWRLVPTSNAKREDD
jgi:hypothetical protein